MTKHYTGHRITVNFRVRDVPFPRSRTKYMPGEGGDRKGLRVASRIEGGVHERLHLSAQKIVDRDLYLRRRRDFETEADVPTGGVGEGRVERELIREPSRMTTASLRGTDWEPQLSRALDQDTFRGSAFRSTSRATISPKSRATDTSLLEVSLPPNGWYLYSLFPSIVDGSCL